MSALRISDYRTGEVRLQELPPYSPWGHTEPLTVLPGRLVGHVAVASDRVPFARTGSFDAKSPRPKRITEARRANNREAARRYRARKRAA